MERYANINPCQIRLSMKKVDLIKWFKDNKAPVPSKGSGKKGRVLVRDLVEARKAFLSKGGEEEKAETRHEPAGPGSFVKAMAKALSRSLDELSSRIEDVRWGPIGTAEEDVILFEVDGKTWRGKLEGRNKDLVLSGNPELDAKIALRTLVDNNAGPTSRAPTAKTSPEDQPESDDPSKVTRKKMVEFRDALNQASKKWKTWEEKTGKVHPQVSAAQHEYDEARFLRMQQQAEEIAKRVWAESGGKA